MASPPISRRGRCRTLAAGTSCARWRRCPNAPWTLTFTVPGLPGTCRLQLFTAAGARPVAVVTQIAGEEGMGLMNGVERYAGAVWERHCPDEEVPPVWVEWQLWPEGARQESHFTLGDGIPEFNGVRSGRP